MERPDDTLIPPDTRWLTDRSARAVCDAVQSGGFSIYFVGGCVRNAILGLADSDVDLATDARPEQVVALADAAGLKTVPTGIEHGTVTVVSGGVGFEVTTFRRDVETDGRRAVVAFTDEIAEDARRRDFTMNALYATPDGALVDPLGGLADLLTQRVRFIEDADARIREDYLRALRYYRLQAWYGDPAQGPDPDALDAIARNLSGLETLSAERVGAEMAKLLRAPDPVGPMASMRATGVLAVLLPGSVDTFLGPVVHVEASLGRNPDWILRLAALGGEDVAQRLRLNRTDARDLAAIREAADDEAGPAEIAYRSGERVATAATILRAAWAGAPLPVTVQRDIATGAQAVFPVKAADLMPEFAGPELGARLAGLERRWIASGFALSRKDLLSRE